MYAHAFWFDRNTGQVKAVSNNSVWKKKIQTGHSQKGNFCETHTGGMQGYNILSVIKCSKQTKQIWSRRDKQQQQKKKIPVSSKITEGDEAQGDDHQNSSKTDGDVRIVVGLINKLSCYCVQVNSVHMVQSGQELWEVKKNI